MYALHNIDNLKSCIMVLAATSPYTSTQGIVNASVVFFALAAIFGLITLITLFRKRKTPKRTVYIHGGLALLGLLLIIIYSVKTPDYYPLASLILFIAAALGGLYLFTNDMQGKEVPLWLAPLHGIVALVAFVLLIIFVAG